jgi:ABC-type sugar transport system permease subunit
LQKDTTEKRGETGILSDLKQGYQYILSDKALLILLFMVMVIHFFVGSIEIFMPVIANAISDDGARNLGFFQTAFGVGTIIMAVILSIISFILYKEAKHVRTTEVLSKSLT